MKTEKPFLLLLLLAFFVSMIYVPLQFLSIISLSGVILYLNKSRLKFDLRALFYIGLIGMCLLQVGLFFRDDYSLNFVLNSLLSSLFWILSFICYWVLKSVVQNREITFTQRLVDDLFKINIALIVLQYLYACYVTKSPLPFASGMIDYGMSTGDHLKGIFTNSSTTMIIMSFYVVYYIYKKQDKKKYIAILATLGTTYMSGILIFSLIVGVYILFIARLRTKVFFLAASAILVGFVFLVTPENIDYVEHIFTEKLNNKEDPIRKLVSFEQTKDNFLSSPSTALIGEGGGKFSSRTAFITGGEYVSWWPHKLNYRSEAFHKNHFQLWNRKALFIAFRDGTHNQPFSFYNQIVGEYGLAGVALFLLYIIYHLIRWRKFTYARVMILVLPGFLFLDYWFDYLNVILFFELFVNLNLKENEALET